ncbi:cardiotrophin-1-like [Discoglossus pictus]
MEVLRVDHLSAVFSLPQDQDGKEEKVQLRKLVTRVRSMSEGLVSTYLSFQGPPFSNPGYLPSPTRSQLKGIPILDTHNLPASPWKRLDLSLSAFLSFVAWFTSVKRWQESLNSKATKLIQLLDTCQQDTRALCSSIGVLLGKTELFSPAPPEVSRLFDQKVIGCVVCQCFCDWLVQTERDMVILVAETSV